MSDKTSNFRRIKIDIFMTDGFDTHDDTKKVCDALAVVLEPDLVQFTLDQALEIINVRVDEAIVYQVDVTSGVRI